MPPVPSLKGTIAARTAVGAALTSVATLALLHGLRPDLAPGAHMVSEYAVGPYGFVMTACFAAWAVGSFALFLALLGHQPTLLGRIGLALLLAAAAGQAMGALFPMDPVGTDPEAMTWSGRMHGVAFMIGVPGQLFGTVLLSIALRRQAAWKGAPLAALTAVMWVSVVVMGVGIASFMQHGAAGGTPTFGWPNRLLMMTYSAWTAAAAWPLTRARPQ